MNGMSSPTGRLSMKKVSPPKRPLVRNLDDAYRYGVALLPFSRKAAWQRKNRENFERSLADQDAFDHGRIFAIGHLWLTKLSLDGTLTDYGLASCRVVTDTGVQYIVDALQNITEMELMKFHGLGTGTTAEGATQTALITELTTQYSSSNTRPTGSLGEKSGDAKTYETVATITVSASVAATEHGIFSTSGTGTGVMLDRSLFSVINLASGESLLATYDLTFPSGS